MTQHAVPAKSPDAPVFQLPSSLSALMLPLCVGGLVLLIAGVALGNFAVDMQFTLSSYLTAFVFCFSIALGSLFFVMIQHLCRAGWSVVVRRVAELWMVMMVPLSILFLPILVTLFTDEGALYAWDNPDYANEHGYSVEAWLQKTRYLDASWFTLRAVVYLGIWSALAIYYFRTSRRQDETGEVKLTEKMQAWSGPGIILASIFTTFAAFDWIMSLAPTWFSTMFGVYLFTGGMLAAHCAIAVGTYLLQRCGAMRDEVTAEHYHDLGKLIFGFIVFWAYIGFSQYMLIWYGNIPEETHWFYTRELGPWEAISLSLVFLHWLLPFFATMSLHVRRRAGWVAAWSVYILAVHYIDVYWMIMPEAGVGLGGGTGVLASLLCVLGMLALMLGLMLRVAAQGRVVPVRDPRLGESLAFENV